MLRIRFLAAVIIGVHVLSSAAGAAQSSADQAKFLAISLKCPAENGGFLELVSADKLGLATRVQIRFQRRIATLILVEAAKKDFIFAPELSIDLTTETDPARRKYGEAIALRLDNIRKSVCRGSEKDRSAYFATLKANKEKLGLH